MDKERKPMAPEEMDVIITRMQRRGRYSNEVIQLVQSDLEFGLSKEEIEQYTSRKYDIRQIRVYSNCLRKKCTKEEIAVICKTGLNSSQMEVLSDFYEKGVPLDTIRSIMEQTGGIPQRMKKAYEKLAAFQESQEDESKEKSEEKLKLLETGKEDEAIRQGLIDELSEKDSLLEKQQEELNKATGAIARLRREKENCEGEMKKMQNQIEELQKKVREQERETPIREPEQLQNTDSKADVKPAGQFKASPQTIGFGIPVYYQIPVVDGNGHFVQKVPVEKTERKPNGAAAVLAKLCFKKKSRADIVKLVASGELVPAQLVQIKSAIEKGLTESQLVELINNNVAAEKMKEIIEIAVLENSMA